ncbi:MAG TPA: thiamine pyrophosphate-dependent enzyme, partial [Microthrixaceae bacterium]|nr:thiamine pyrophosphate-dependent enzyme [Microthrixaceae bacterium]
ASATVLSNRGANGIDGVTSTAVGVALASQRPTVCLIGDVAFLHDTNAMLGLASRAAPLCVVVIDNDGGGIFSFLPQADQLDGERFEQLFGTPHRTHLLGLAGAHRIETIDIGSVERTPAIEELREVVRAFRERPRPLVVRVRSDRAVNVAAHRDLNDRVAAAARAALGPTGG